MDGAAASATVQLLTEIDARRPLVGRSLTFRSIPAEAAARATGPPPRGSGARTDRASSGRTPSAPRSSERRTRANAKSAGSASRTRPPRRSSVWLRPCRRRASRGSNACAVSVPTSAARSPVARASVLADGTPVVSVIATEPAGPPLPLRERVRRLLADRRRALAAFAREGTLVTEPALTRFVGTATLSTLGVDAVAARPCQRQRQRRDTLRTGHRRAPRQRCFDRPGADVCCAGRRNSCGTNSCRSGRASAFSRAGALRR